ncbi:MAG TPA: WG repeat-containing protein [Saprospiraceae bacterium]|nr:WG repeat-containing protein [Saprospiraceae bacterium]
MIISCKRDSREQGEVADREAEYFEDYDSPSNKWGFLDTQGTVVIPAKYDQVSGFKEALAPVNFEGRWGFIDQQGNPVIPFSFRAAWQFRNGVARVIDFTGAPCILYRNGRKICPVDMTEAYDFSEGLAVFQRGIIYGYMDTTGNAVIEPRFEEAWRFENGTARVMIRGKQGLINREGEFVVRPEYEKVYAPSSQRILVKQNVHYHFLNMQGDQVGAHYLQATPYVDEVAAVADAYGWMLIDLQERPLNETRYSHLRPANEGRWIARQVDHFAVLDSNGIVLTPFQYAQINNFSEGYTGYLRDDLWGILDLTGKEVTPPQFGLVWDFHEGLARAAFQNGIAFVTTSGEVPFIPEYPELRDFSEGLAPFQE